MIDLLTRSARKYLPRGFAALGFAGYLVVQSLPAHAASPDGFEDLAEALLPTVVNVSTTAKVPQAQREQLPPMPDLPPGSPFEQFFKDFYDQYKNQQQPEGDEKVAALGSGFIIDADKGLIVTNNHVIKDAEEIKVILHDDETLDAKLVGADEKTDVAVLQVKPSKNMTAVKWGDSDTAKVGSWVLAIGNPFGLGGTVTAGIVSARQRDINAGPYDDFIQTDASINRGNSGGPMFNMKGEVIGINTAIFSPSGGSVGIGFAVPSNIVKNVVDQLVKYGKTKRGWLGVRIQEVTPEIAESLGLSKPMGAMVSSVTPDGPAAKAGIEAGDVVLSFNAHDIDHMKKLPRLVAETEVGKQAPVIVFHKGTTKTLNVTLGQLETAEASGVLNDGDDDKDGPDTKKPAVPKGVALPGLGIDLAAITDKARQTYDLGKIQGVLISKVQPDSPAQEKGLTEGDVIVTVDQQDVATPQDVISKVEAAKKAGHSSVLFFVGRKSDMRFVAVKLKK